MSHPERHIRAFIDDGPHAGETLEVSPELDGKPPKRIVLDSPERRHGLGDATSLNPDATEATTDSVTYELHHADEEIGIWVYRASRAGDVHPG